MEIAEYYIQEWCLAALFKDISKPKPGVIFHVRLFSCHSMNYEIEIKIFEISKCQNKTRETKDSIKHIANQTQVSLGKNWRNN